MKPYPVFFRRTLNRNDKMMGRVWFKSYSSNLVGYSTLVSDRVYRTASCFGGFGFRWADASRFDCGLRV